MKRPRRIRFWMKLAVFAAFGVIVTHWLHLAIGSFVSKRALIRLEEDLGRNIAGLIAQKVSDAVLVEDFLSLHEVVTNAVSKNSVAYCFILHEGRILASSNAPGPTRILEKARRVGEQDPIVIIADTKRYLDLTTPILDGRRGSVRVGLDMSVVRSTERHIDLLLRALAIAIVGAGIIAAMIVGRWISQPVSALIDAIDGFDPSKPPQLVQPRGSDELAELTQRFNKMILRLRTAYEEQAQARQKEAATERLAALGTLTAGVAHEVNNPLAGMKNCVRWLERDDGTKPAKRREYLGMLIEGIERIEGLVRRLLGSARPQAFKLEVVPVRDILEDGFQLVDPVLSGRRIVLPPEMGPLRVVADRKQAVQALVNVLLNAIYVSDQEGEIRIHLRRDDGRCGIAVEDDGPGISPEIRARVFEPFFSTKPEGEGTGLGLSVSKSLLQAQGGDLTLEFPTRGGTVAMLWLRSAPLS